MFIDEAEIVVKGGDGGNGKVAYYANRSGTSGGDGGRGGRVVFILSNNVTTLKKYTEKTVFKAENGVSGGSNKSLGANGKDLLLLVPNNTTVIDLGTKKEAEINTDNPQLVVCYGGLGGRGNNAFKTSTNQTPRTAEKGAKGEERHLKLILKLIADYGLMGLPNAGKSSLLNVLTKASVKVAAYPFTTLEPNLGVFNSKVIADIPGLIEGASTGKGLGIKFLKHIEKVSLLFHCISCQSEDIVKDYQTVIQELGKYSKNLLNKKSIILLTKIDLIKEDEVQKLIKKLSEYNSSVLPISIYNPESLDKLKNIFNLVGFNMAI